jgi:hypothetical protein
MPVSRAWRRNAAPSSMNRRKSLFSSRHDFYGLANEELCFLPRISGYSMRYKEGKKIE